MLYIYTYLPVIIHTDGVSEKSHSTSKYRNFYFSLEGVSVRKLCNRCHSAGKKKSGLKMKDFLLSPVTS